MPTEALICYFCLFIKYCLATGLKTFSNNAFLSFLPRLCSPQYSVSSSMVSGHYAFKYRINEFTAVFLQFSALCYTPKQRSVVHEMVHFFCFSNSTKTLSVLVTTDPPLTLENWNVIIWVLKCLPSFYLLKKYHRCVDGELGNHLSEI